MRSGDREGVLPPHCTLISLVSHLINPTTTAGLATQNTPILQCTADPFDSGQTVEFTQLI